jgi:hypothetical protein
MHSKFNISDSLSNTELSIRTLLTVMRGGSAACAHAYEMKQDPTVFRRSKLKSIYCGYIQLQFKQDFIFHDLSVLSRI